MLCENAARHDDEGWCRRGGGGGDNDGDGHDYDNNDYSSVVIIVVIVVVIVGKRGHTVAPSTRDYDAAATVVAANIDASSPGCSFLSVD